MATRPKAVIESRNGEKFSPITIAKNVLTDDGQNLHDILSDRKEDMMTSTIENSSSMSKVGQGDNVDYSENVVDGAYESCVLKGRSLVNLADLFNFNDNITISSHYVDKTVCETNRLKLNTPYLFLFKPNVSSNLNDYTTFELGIANKVNNTQTHPSMSGGSCAINGIKHNQWNYIKVTFTDFKGYKYLTVRPLRTINPDPAKPITYNVKEGLMLIEYQEGMENWDIPYFTGLCDVKSPILSNVGKNLWDIDKLSDAVCINKTNDSFVLKSWASTVLTNQQIREILKPNTKYTMRAKFRLLKGSSLPSYSQDVQFLLYAPNETSTNVSFFLAGRTHTIGEEYEVTNTFTTPSDFTTKNLLGYSKRYANDSTWELGEVEFTDVQLEEMSQATEYEPYKSNTTTFDQKDGKTIVLRSLPNGVCDTLNLNTGEYIQRIGETVLDGSWGAPSQELNGYFISYYSLSDIKKENGGNVYCDKFASHGQIWVGGREGISTFSNGTIWLSISSSKLATSDIDGMKKWLSQNPITVQYELATPIVKQINVEGYPYAYENGYILLESGSQEQSLTPTIEYSVVTNRNGQIRSNQKMVERHQKQLDRLQAMVLTNLVNTQYEQTLTNLKYDLKNVREEVK